MQTVTVSFKDSSNRDKTEVFEVYDRKELTSEQRNELFSNHAIVLGPEEWEDGGAECQAALQAGFAKGTRVIVRWVRK